MRGERGGSISPKKELARINELIEPQCIILFFLLLIPSILPFSIAPTSFTNQESSRTDIYPSTDTLY